MKLEWAREEYGGNWYFSPEFKMEGWLCPAPGNEFKRRSKAAFVRSRAVPSLLAVEGKMKEKPNL